MKTISIQNVAHVTQYFSLGKKENIKDNIPSYKVSNRQEHVDSDFLYVCLDPQDYVTTTQVEKAQGIIRACPNIFRDVTKLVEYVKKDNSQKKSKN
jgi:hypothetical protein